MKLGIRVSTETVKKYMRRARRGLVPPEEDRPGQPFWPITRERPGPCDFVQAYDVFCRAIFVYFIIALGSRRVVQDGVTRAPSDIWVAQQVREATPYDERPRFLIRDHDKQYGACFTRVAQDRGIDVIRTPVCAPKANAVCDDRRERRRLRSSAVCDGNASITSSSWVSASCIGSSVNMWPTLITRDLTRESTSASPTRRNQMRVVWHRASSGLLGIRCWGACTMTIEGLLEGRNSSGPTF